MVHRLRFLVGNPTFACTSYSCTGVVEKVVVITWRNWLPMALKALEENHFSLTRLTSSWYREYSNADRNLVRKITAHRNIGKGPGYVTILPKSNSQRVNQMCSWCGKNMLDPNLFHESPVLVDDLWIEMLKTIGYSGPDQVPWGTLCCRKCVNRFLAETRHRSILPEDLKDCGAKTIFLDWQAKKKEEREERKAMAAEDDEGDEFEDETDTDND